MADRNLLRMLLADSVSTFCVLFRHALILSGAEPKYGKREVIELARERFGIDPSPFLTLIELREEKVKPRDIDPLGLLADYMKQIQTVIDAVDRLEK